MPIKLTPLQLEFVFENKNTMRHTDIAKEVKVSKARISQILKPKAKVIVMECYFDIDKEYKQCYGV